MDNETYLRVEQFRQLKEQIRGCEEYLIVGIDISKNQHHAFFGTPNGITVKRRLIFKNDFNGFLSLLSMAEVLRDQNGLWHIVFGMEPTGNYHKPLGMFLINRNQEVVLVSGIATQRNRELLDDRWDKNDTKCAANVADLISQGKCLFYEQPTPEISGLRSLLSLRERMKKNYHILRMRIRNNLVAEYFPEFDRFENRKQVLKMSGFDLSAKRSGKGSDKAYPVISKKGSNTLRYALFQAAVIASSRNKYFIQYYTNTMKGREKERGIKIKMRVKLAAKLLIIAWTIMKTKNAFNPDLVQSVK